MQKKKQQLGANEIQNTSFCSEPVFKIIEKNILYNTHCIEKHKRGRRWYKWSLLFSHNRLLWKQLYPWHFKTPKKKHGGSAASLQQLDENTEKRSVVAVHPRSWEETMRQRASAQWKGPDICFISLQISEAGLRKKDIHLLNMI